MGCISSRTNLYRSFLKTVPGGEDSEAGAGGGVKVGNNSAGKVGEHYLWRAPLDKIIRLPNLVLAL